MIILRITVGALFAAAVYFILADVFKLPYVRTSKAVNNLSKSQREKTSSIDVWLGNLASFIAKRLPMNEFKKQELETDLRTAQMDITPEMYKANAIVKSLLVAVLAVPMIFIFPILAPIILVLAFVLYRINTKSVSSRIKAKRASLENDLPRLAGTIQKTLIRSRNIVDMLQDFYPHANKELQHELGITVADMRSGNEEAAVTRLEARVGSPMMSDVCRGLITLIHGDEAQVYWSSLAMKFSDIQRQRLRIEAQKIPKKVKRLSMCLLVCFMLIYVVVIVSQIMSSVGVMFG